MPQRITSGDAAVNDTLMHALVDDLPFGGHCQDNDLAGWPFWRYAAGMAPISYRRHRFPVVMIEHAVWLYLRFTLSYRDVEDLLRRCGSSEPKRQRNG